MKSNFRVFAVIMQLKIMFTNLRNICLYHSCAHRDDIPNFNNLYQFVLVIIAIGVLQVNMHFRVYKT